VLEKKIKTKIIKYFVAINTSARNDYLYYLVGEKKSRNSTLPEMLHSKRILVTIPFHYRMTTARKQSHNYLGVGETPLIVNICIYASDETSNVAKRIKYIRNILSLANINNVQACAR
jgi:hypothetical protein